MAELKNHPGMWLRDDAANQLNAYEDKYGVLALTSAGRTEAEQQALINRWNAGGKHNRPPYLYAPAIPAASSNHVKNGGLAVDVSSYDKFAQHSKEFGFVRPLPGSDPVHFEFVGVTKPAAAPNQVTKDRQNWLTSIGISVGKSGADGIDGPATKEAYKTYQKALRDWGYTGAIDGIWGPATQKAHQRKFDAMHAAPAAPAAPLTTASFGRVDVVQRALKTKYPLYAGRLVVDNIDGPKTKAAVSEFQRRAGLKVDGIAGPATRKALGI